MRHLFWEITCYFASWRVPPVFILATHRNTSEGVVTTALIELPKFLFNFPHPFSLLKVITLLKFSGSFDCVYYNWYKVTRDVHVLTWTGITILQQSDTQYIIWSMDSWQWRINRLENGECTTQENFGKISPEHWILVAFECWTLEACNLCFKALENFYTMSLLRTNGGTRAADAPPVSGTAGLVVGYTEPKNVNFNGQVKKMDFLCRIFSFCV